jgi:hypothetical protein
LFSIPCAFAGGVRAICAMSLLSEEIPPGDPSSSGPGWLCSECNTPVDATRVSCPACGAPASQFRAGKTAASGAGPVQSVSPPDHHGPAVASSSWIFGKTAFRLFLAATLLLSFIQQIVSAQTVASLPEPLRSSVLARETAATTDAMVALGIVLLPLVLTTLIGLFVFWRPARILYLLQACLSLVVTPFLGPTIETGWGTCFLNLNMLLEGVLIGLLFFSPVQELFRRPRGIL